MVRTATKRKSEGDLPEKSKKPKAKVSTSVKPESNSSQEQDASSEELFVEQPKPVYVKKDRPKVRKSAPARMDEEFFQDDGRMETQQFIALVGLQAKKKKMATKSSDEFTEKFKVTIQSEEDALKKRVEELGTVAANEDTDFLKNFTRAYTSSRPAPLPKSADPEEPDPMYFSTLYKRSNALIQSSRNIIDHFVATSEATAKLEATVGLNQQVAAWKAENDSMVQLMDVGHKAGVQKVEAMLDGKEGMELEEGDVRIVDLLYGVGENGEGGEMGVGEGVVWGRLVKNQLKAGKRLYKTTMMEVGA